MRKIQYEPADIVIYRKDQGLVCKEKSLVAFDMTSKKILAYGTEAEKMLGQETQNIMVVSPLRQGMVADYEAAVSLFTHLLQQVWGNKPFHKPSVVVCLPAGATYVEQKAISETLYQSGVKQLMIADIPPEQFMALPQMGEQLPKDYAKYSIVIGITKDDPEGYIKEELKQILQYAEQKGISAKRAAQLLQELQEVHN